MMKHEFEQIAGYEVTSEAYDKIIEPMYMSLDVSKQEFVKMIDKKYFALPTKKECLKKMRRLAEVIQQACGFRTTYDEETELQHMADEFAQRFYNSAAYLKKEGTVSGCSFVRSIEIYQRSRGIAIETINLI